MPESIWKTDEPLVSIIVPVYNAAPDLATCIESARRQRYQNIEILLVNDGSSDASLDICRMYAQRDPRFHVIDKENSGVSATRNLAIERAQGKYLQFLDSDDWLDVNATRLLVERAEETGADLVISHFCRVADDKIAVYGFLNHPRVMDQRLFARHLLDEPASFYYGVMWNKLYRRDLIRMAQIRFENVVFAEDQLFNTRYLQAAQRFAAIDEAVYCYIQNPQSVCHTQVRVADMLRHRDRMYRAYRQMCIQLGVYDRFRLRLRGIYLSLFESPLPNGPVQRLSDAAARTHSRI